MKNWMWAFAGMSALAFAGCTKDQAGEHKPEAKLVETKQPTPTPPAAAAAEGGGGAGEAGGRQMANCPSTVEGATTKIEDGAGAVVVIVTAAQEGATKEIRERSKHLAEVSVKAPAEIIKHTGEGEGGGGLGNCPVVLADTTISSEDVPGGAKLTVKPMKAEDLPKVKALAAERHAKAGAAATPPAPPK